MLDAIAISIASIVRMLWCLAVRTRWDDRQNVAQEQVLAEAVAIIAFVGKQGGGLWHRHGHQAIDPAVIGRLAARQVEAEREALIVAAGVDLARKAAA